jgi:hypothetical protein
MKCITAQYSRAKSDHIDLERLLKEHGSLGDRGFQYIAHFPTEVHIEEPEHLPEKVARPFQQAISNLSSQNWDAAGTMARKTLDVATRDIARGRISDQNLSESIAKEWLKKRIKRLSDVALLTRELADLASVIKDGGDEAAHDDDPYEEVEARKLINYAQAFLTYIYTVPGMVEEVRRQELAEPAAAAVEP